MSEETFTPAHAERLINAVRAVAKRVSNAERGLNGAIQVIEVLVRSVDQLNPRALDAELRRMRLEVQAAEAGRFETKILETRRAALLILENAMDRQAPEG